MLAFTNCWIPHAPFKPLVNFDMDRMIHVDVDAAPNASVSCKPERHPRLRALWFEV